VRTLAEIPRQLLNVLQAVKDQKEAAWFNHKKTSID
jgi:hypothetical protein